MSQQQESKTNNHTFWIADIKTGFIIAGDRLTDFQTAIKLQKRMNKLFPNTEFGLSEVLY